MGQPANQPADKSGPVLIDLYQVLQGKLGKKSRFVPKGLVRWLERTVCIDELNDLLRDAHPRRGAAFCQRTLSQMGATVELAPGTQWPDPSHGRIIIVSNHPMGGLEGLAIIELLTQHYGEGVKVVVNDLLSFVEPLSETFLPVNKHGKQSRQSIEAITEAMEGDKPIVVFPAGLVSRLGDDGQIRDVEWHKMFVTKALQYHRDVLPIYFSGELSRKFYKFARRRTRLGLKLNIEMVYLPREMVHGECRHFVVRPGELIPWQQLRDGASHEATAQQVKEIVYALGENM